jgi:hypothetical protein
VLRFGVTSRQGDKHRKRFARWQQRVPEQTRLLSELLETRVEQHFANLGFQVVDNDSTLNNIPVDPSVIRMERWADEHVDYVEVHFGNSPRFQFYARRRRKDPPHEFLRAAGLVKRSSQYYYLWGKPWWMPLRLWSPNAIRRLVDQVASRFEEVLVFLDTGKRGPHISRDSINNPTNS